MTASQATAKETSVDAALVAFFSELDGIFKLKVEQRTALTAFSMDNVFLLYF